MPKCEAFICGGEQKKSGDRGIENGFLQATAWCSAVSTASVYNCHIFISIHNRFRWVGTKRNQFLLPWLLHGGVDGEGRALVQIRTNTLRPGKTDSHAFNAKLIPELPLQSIISDLIETVRLLRNAIVWWSQKNARRLFFKKKNYLSARFLKVPTDSLSISTYVKWFQTRTIIVFV